MGYDLLAQYCSPVLGKVKPANLFTISNTRYDVNHMLDSWNKDFNKYNIYFIILSKREKSSSILCYREDLLTKQININCVKSFLSLCGYDTDNAKTCANCMKKRFLENEFPHEIGLLLGYPYEDVIGFIENKGENYLMSGYWKVYENMEEKAKIFALYNHLRREYLNASNKDINLLKLIVE